MLKPVVIGEDGVMRTSAPDTEYPVYPLVDGAVVPTSFEVDGKRWELTINVKSV